MFAGLFERAEASVDNAIGDLGNRVLIAIPFIAAAGFLAASLWLVADPGLWTRDRKSRRCRRICSARDVSSR